MSQSSNINETISVHVNYRTCGVENTHVFVLSENPAVGSVSFIGNSSKTKTHLTIYIGGTMTTSSAHHMACLTIVHSLASIDVNLQWMDRSKTLAACDTIRCDTVLVPSALLVIVCMCVYKILASLASEKRLVPPFIIH